MPDMECASGVLCLMGGFGSMQCQVKYTFKPEYCSFPMKVGCMFHLERLQFITISQSKQYKYNGMAILYHGIWIGNVLVGHT